MQLRSWALTDVGRVREHNEDGWIIDDDLGLFAVADGMGGHAAGEVASALALRTIRDHLAEQSEPLNAFIREPSSERRAAVRREVEAAVNLACREIYELGQRDAERRGMGTTLTMLLVAGSTGFMAHVGDSRLYLLRSGNLHQLSEDHSYLWEQIKKGEMTAEQASRSRFRNVITRAVGITETVQVDTLVLDVLPGDTFLACSDGLHGYLQSDAELAAVLSEGGELSTPRLVQLANERGGKDNITCMVVEAPGDARHPSALDIIGRIDALQQIPLFRHLDYAELVKVLNATEVETFEAGAVIISEEEAGDEFYVVLSGEVEVSKGGRALTTLGEKAHFGEMALVDRSPRSASVMALVDTRTLSLDRRAFFGLVKREPVLSSKLLWSFVQVLSHRLRSANDALSSARADLLGFDSFLDDDPTREIIPAPGAVDEAPTDPRPRGSE
jgi:serine/threonine protein phosphatase PrpC/CRP-like cAMP-binding protein